MSSVLTVTQLNKYISFKIKGDLKLKGIALKGEISNFSVHYKSGHAYFTIKDSDSSLKAVMFNSSFSKLKFTPENGMNVLVVGNIEVYERDGIYQIIVTEITPMGIGFVHSKIEDVKNKLIKKGIFDVANKKPIPLVPKTIAVVTSLTGAALQDIIRIVQRRYPICKLKIFPTQVQGEFAEKNICNALQSADRSGSDTIILARGGGSVEDLMPFNTESVAIAVASCLTPVISAVGHETDTSLSDYAADMRAATPSAAAEIATPDINDVINSVNVLAENLNKNICKKIDGYISDLEFISQKLKLNSPQKKLAITELSINTFVSKLKQSMTNRIKKSDFALDKINSQLNLLSPFNVLGRGYALVEKNGSVIDSANLLSSGDHVTIKFSDSSVTAEIIERSDDIKGDD